MFDTVFNVVCGLLVVGILLSTFGVLVARTFGHAPTASEATESPPPVAPVQTRHPDGLIGWYGRSEHSREFHFDDGTVLIGPVYYPSGHEFYGTRHYYICERLNNQINFGLLGEFKIAGSLELARERTKALASKGSG